MKEFLDEVGGRYIVQRVKQMINAIEADCVTKQELQSELDALDINIDLSAYATKEELSTALRNIDLSAYATKEYVTDAINNAQLGGDGSSVDLSIYAKKSDLDSKANTNHTHTMSDITDYTEPDLSSYAMKTDIPSLNGYALKTEIPSIDGLATTEYVDNAIANVPSGGNVDLSNYYTKAETYSKTEVDTAISNIEGGGNTSSDSCALYDTVVSNGGAVKEIIETEKPVGTNLSEIISDVANGKEIVGDGNGNFYISMNPDKTQEELNAEFVLPNDKNGSLDFLLASSFQPEEIIIKNSEDRLKLRNRLKNGERMHYIIATNKGNNDGNYEFYYGEIFYNRISENGYSQDTCYNDMYKIFQGNVKFNLLKYMQNMKYICSGAYYNDRRSISSGNGNYAHYNDKQEPNDWLRFKKYIPTGTEYKSPSSTTAVSENISSPEFSAHLLDTYLSNCNETLKISETVNYTLAEWGDKLDNSQGKDGISPTVSITGTDNGHTVSITDVNGAKSFDVTNGTNGTNGVSPIVTVTKEGKVATITCTDVNGTTTATISDGADGQGGSGGASGITYVYDTEIATGDTYFDGRPIYMRILHIDPLSSAPSSYIVYGNYKNQTPFADKVISAEPLWYTTSSTQNVFTGNIIQSFTSVSGSSGSAAVTAVNNLLKTVAWVQAWQNSSEFGITVTRGQDMYNYACDIFVKYVKSA